MSTTPAAGTLNYYRATVPINPPAPVCPSTSAVSCAQVGSDDYHDNIACASTFQFSCGQTVGAGQTVTVGGGGPASVTNEGTQCLIHANGQGPARTRISTADRWHRTASGHDQRAETITRILLLQGVTSISRSDSVVTVPIYHSAANVPISAPAGLHRNRRRLWVSCSWELRRTLRGHPTGRSKA